MAMDEDESDVLLAASEDGKSDWVLDSGSAYHLCRDREVCSTYAACEGRIWIANNMSSTVVGRGSVRFCIADGRSVTLTEVRHVPNLRKNLISIGMLDSKGCSFDASGRILRGELLSNMGPVVLARRVDKGSNRCTEVRKASTGVLGRSVMVPGGSEVDVNREAKRKETKSILRSCTAKGAVMPKRVSFALDLISGGVLSSCAHKRGEMEPRQLAKYLGCCLAVLWGNWIRSCQEGQLENIRLPSSGLEGRLLSPAHLDEFKPTWMSPSPVAKPKPDWSSYGVSI
ncbi:hypothetical protein Acr_24g0004420 [Actinidia rufa]|uniref:Retrovirus-related Pol polyprotein from transposon TNT 1-94-like beta-barrel domain-containing protein n=1 Tax=Actinidia rufa TaxID=165716 RepID=A0A7J0GTY7_9ERIC|nr:hypothetical protein Acr_24g0004420 [Actinidia rufa]